MLLLILPWDEDKEIGIDWWALVAINAYHGLGVCGMLLDKRFAGSYTDWRSSATSLRRIGRFVARQRD